MSGVIEPRMCLCGCGEWIFPDNPQQFLKPECRQIYYYNKFKGEGKCVVCCKPNDNLPHICCTVCAEKQKQDRRARRRRRSEAGLCNGCGLVPPLPNRTKCEECLFLANVASKRCLKRKRMAA